MPRAFAVGAVLVALALVAGACSRAAGSAPTPSLSGSAASDEPIVLGDRAEVVARADALAVAGAHGDGAAGLDLTRRAAELRRRLWRLEGREADALEAIELWRGLEMKKNDVACQSQIDRVLLEGELHGDPAETYRGVYRARAGATKGPCRDKADRVLGALVAFRPLPNVLAEIARQATGDAGGASDGGASAASVKLDPNGPVVVPTLNAISAGGPARITSVARYGAKDAARVVVFVTRPTLFEVGFIPAESGGRGPRLYVDIDSASYKGKLEYTVGGLVERVRLGKRAKGTRVVLDLSSTVYRRVFYLPEPFRLVIDVSKEAPAPVAHGGDGPLELHRVVLDPGHGGHDPGAIGPSGLREKDVTLDIAHRAAPLLARELGVSTLLTRDSDDFIPLDERAARANAFQADLFVSIHCNASEDPSAHGYMSFVLDDSRDPAAFRVAARENAASPAAAAEFANVMSHVLDASSVQRSVRLADLIQRATGASLQPSYGNVSDGGVKRAGFYVLAGARMPAVLFEVSFISNPGEEARLNTGDYRQKLADAVVNAVRAYREGK
jgi:N-acetylmuramoyl-L-alanine amidase